MLSDHFPEDMWKAFSNAEWDTLSQSALSEGLAPLLYWKLSKSGRLVSLPEPAQHALRAAYAQSWRQNQRIIQELKDISRQFEEAAIPTVVLKGACLILTNYPDPGLRPMSDLDLMIPLEQLPEAVEIVKGLGFKQPFPEASPGLSDLLDHAVYLNKEGEVPIALELHRSLVAEGAFRYAVPVDWFWSQTEIWQDDLQRQFGALRVLSPTAQILYASAHAALQHGGNRALLVWYYDIDCLVRVHKESVDWDLLLSQAVEFEWASALRASLIQTAGYFGTPLPERVLKGLARDSDRHQGLVEQLKHPPGTHILEERQKLMKLHGYARFRLLLALFAPSPAYMRWRYKFRSNWMLPAYYLIRWWGILQDGFLTIRALTWKPAVSEREAMVEERS
jgi:hypothetical protein